MMPVGFPKPDNPYYPFPMPDYSTPELAERIARLVHLAEVMNRKIDALTDCVVNISRRLDSVEERLFAQALMEPETAEKMEQIATELEDLEKERAAHRLSVNTVSPSELVAILAGR